LWKFTRTFWNCEAPSFTNFLISTLNKIITHYRWPTTSLFIVNICSPSICERSTLFVLQFIHSLRFSRKPPRIIHDEFPQHSWFSVKKADNSANFAAGGLSVADHVITL
jgi:hypothetical protein